MTGIRILSVRQPWAWAIIHAGKDVENRPHNPAGGYRGPIAIHASKTDDTQAWRDAMEKYSPLGQAIRARRMEASHRPTHDEWVMLHNYAARGAIIGVVDLVDVHEYRAGFDGPEAAGGCGTCSQWAAPEGWHLVLADPRPLPAPIPWRGSLGLRRFDTAEVSDHGPARHPLQPLEALL